MSGVDLDREFRTIFRWARLGLLGTRYADAQLRRLRLLALGERLGLTDEEMLNLKGHPLWDAKAKDWLAEWT